MADRAICFSVKGRRYGCFLSCPGFRTLKICSAEPCYDSTANIYAITERGGLPLIPLNPGNEKPPPGIIATLGTPLCPDELPRLY